MDHPKPTSTRITAGPLNGDPSEVGNPSSGKIGLPFTDEHQLIGLGFERGWETIYRAPDLAIVGVDVFEFTDTRGPAVIAHQSVAHPQAGYRRRAIDGIPAASFEIGTSPEGRTAAATAFAHGHFLVVLAVGGGPKLHDYAALISKLAREQLAKLP